MSLKNAKNLLSMDVVQLSRHVRQSFHISHLGTEDADENRDLAFQILALKNELQENRREHLKIFYNLIQASHQGFFCRRATRKLYIGFPYLHSHYQVNYRAFSNEKPMQIPGIGDPLLFNAGAFLSQFTYTSACSHIRHLSDDDINRCLHNSHQHDDGVRMNKLYVKVLVELLTKKSLPFNVISDLRAAISTASQSWIIKPTEDRNIDHLIDIFTLTSGVGVDNPGILRSIEEEIACKTFYLPTRVKLLLLFALSCRSSYCHDESPEISNIIKNLLHAFQSDYRSLDLKDSLLLVECFSNLGYRERLLDTTVMDIIFPRLAKIRMEDMIQLLEGFVSLDFRCSKVIKSFEESPIYQTLSIVDLAVLMQYMIRYSALVGHILCQLKKDELSLNDLADEKLLRILAASRA